MKKKEAEKDRKESIPERSYFVERESGGIMVTDQESGNQFFLTPEGGCFWLRGPNNPFDEDVELGNREKDYFYQIIAAAGF